MYLQNSLSELFTCKFCKKYFTNPVILPCGQNICEVHVIQNDNSNIFKCDCQHDHHKIPENGFCYNDILIQLMANDILLNAKTKKVKKLFADLDSKCIEFDKIFTKPEHFINCYFSEERNKIDIKREELISKIHDKSAQLIEQTTLVEKELISNLKNVNVDNNFDNLDFINSRDNILSWKNEIFQDPNVSENRFEEIYKSSRKLLKDYELAYNKIKNKIFNGKFYKYSSKIQHNNLLDQFVINNSTSISSDNCGVLIREFKGHTNRVASIQVDEISNIIITGAFDKTIKIWNLETGECLKTLNNHTDWVTCILLLPDDKFISGSDDKTLKIWNLENYECLNTLLNQEGVFSLSLISNNKVACGCRSGLINIWNLDNLSLLRSIKAHSDLVIYLLSNDDELISCSVQHNDPIKIWNLETYECIQVLEGHSEKIYYLELTIDGYLLSCSYDCTVKLWEMESGKMLKSISFNKPVYCVKVVDENVIAVGLADGEIIIYDLNNNEKMKTMLPQWRSLPSSSSSNRLEILSNGSMLSGLNDGRLNLLWNVFEE